MDTYDETRLTLEGLLDADGEYYIGAEPGDGSDAHYRGPSRAVDAIENAINWARAAFSGTEATLATLDGEDYVVAAALTAEGPGSAPKVTGAGRRKKATPEAKPAEAETKPVKSPGTRAPRKATKASGK